VPAGRPCSCGALFPLIQTVKGRSDDIFVYPGGVHVHPLVFRTPLGQNSHIEQYQVHQTEHGAKIGVIATGKLDIAGLKQDLIAALAKAELANADIDIECVDELERHKETGKLRRFIPLPQN
jgi:phenylacetate-coenzyme A ligase PaaK-like adenylate-forming protein